jgi:molybdopterin converting factor subunit 1
MKVKVLFFAMTRELVGIRECDLILDNDNETMITTVTLMEELCRLYPSLLSILDQIVLAVNKAYITDAITLKDGDEIALIPPISGG